MPAEEGFFGFVSKLNELMRFLQTITLVFIAAIIFYFNPEDKFCSMVSSLNIIAHTFKEATYNDISANLKKINARCIKDVDAQHILTVAENDPHAMTNTTTVAWVPGPVVKSDGSLLSKPIEGMVLKPLPDGGSPATPSTSATPGSGSSTAAPKEGWVAVGFVGEAANFTWTSGNDPRQLKSGDEITAKTPVNLRKKQADWTGTSGVIMTGTKVKITEPVVELPAGSLRQVWAKVRVN